MTHARTIFLSTLLTCATLMHVSDARAQDVEFDMDEPDGFEMDESAAAAPGDASTAVAGFMGQFKFGMTREQVLGVVTKEIKVRYLKEIRGTMDTYQQDRLRRKQAEEVERVRKTLVEFEGKPGGWDASIVDDQYAHGTGESMLVSWEAEQGRSQRRFFFFFKGKLYKIFLALDMSAMDEAVRDFSLYKQGLSQRFGKGQENYVGVLWNIGVYRVEALDKLGFYNSFCLVISDNKVLPKLIDERKKHAIKLNKKSKSLQFLLEEDDDATMNLDESSGVVDRVLKK